MHRLLICPPDAYVTGDVTSCARGLYFGSISNFGVYSTSFPGLFPFCHWEGGKRPWHRAVT